MLSAVPIQSTLQYLLGMNNNEKRLIFANWLFGSKRLDQIKSIEIILRGWAAVIH